MGPSAFREGVSGREREGEEKEGAKEGRDDGDEEEGEVVSG